MTEVDLTLTGKARAVHFDSEKKPKIAWTQSAEALGIIVRIPNAKTPIVDVEEQVISIRLSDQEGVQYVANLSLTGKVQKSIDTWTTTIRNGSIKVSLKKQKASEGEWERLVDQPHKLTKNWLEYDWDAHDEVEEDDVEPDEKEQPDVEPRQRPRYHAEKEENEKEVSREEKKSSWAQKQALLEKEAEEIRQTAGTAKRNMGLKFTCEQLTTIMAVAVVLTAFLTHYLTRWMLQV